ncbi:MAG: sorbosone dehydrogenase family protein [Gammaproteobacteria bacterium]
MDAKPFHTILMPFRSLTPVLLSALLCACGGGGSSSGIGVPTPPPVPPPVAVSIGVESAFPSLTFSEPLAALQAPGDPSRWFVVERTGQVWVFDNDPIVTQREIFVDLGPLLFDRAPEAGLLGMAFHPNFAQNGQVFFSYTRPGAPLESVVSRVLSLNGGASLDLTTETMVLTVLQDFANHNGGHIVFGPDGFLYAGFGDGGSSNDPNDRAQTQTTLMGKLLRIDVDQGAPYAIPQDNPFAANARCVQGFGGASCPEIFALGLRNPWRFSFDRTNGELWLGDVGQGRFEEINRIELGDNLGWRIREGANCQTPANGCQTAGLKDPVHEYGRDVGNSVTGGYVYRGTVLPDLQGRYVFGDFASGRLFALPPAPVAGTEAIELLDTSFNISSFAEGIDGELLLLDYTSGQLHSIVPGS